MSPDDRQLDIALDRDADVPLGVQLAWALRARILSGALAAGDRLPSLHRLADELGVNANTVRAVYQRLEQDGLVATRHGSGTFVSSIDDGRRALTQLAADAARAAHAAGVDPRELAAALYVGSERAPADDEALVRRRLRAQIAALERALSEQSARTGRTGPLDDRTAASARPRLLSAAELTQQRDVLLRRLAEEHAEGDPPGGAQPPAAATQSARRRAPKRSPQLRATPRTT